MELNKIIFDNLIAITALATSVATIVYVILTNKILYQQKKEENIKYNPYLNIDNFKISPELKHSEFHINFAIRNSGITPAYKFQVIFEILVKGKVIVNNKSDKMYVMVMPNASRIFRKICDKTVLQAVKTNKEKSKLLITLKYYNYNGQSFQFKNEMGFNYNPKKKDFDYTYDKQDLLIA